MMVTNFLLLKSLKKMDDFLRTAECEGCSEGRQTKRYKQSTHPLRGSDSLGI